MNYLKIELIKSSQDGIGFSTQLLLKIAMFELNYRFLSYRTWAAYMQSILEILLLIHDFLASGNTIWLSGFVTPNVSVKEVPLYPSSNHTLLNPYAEDRRHDLIPVQPWSLWALIFSTQIRLYVHTYKKNLL